MHVSELMSPNVVTIRADDSCLEAVSRMHGARVRHLPVVNAEGGLIGVVTDRDLRHHLFAPRVLKDVGTIAVDIILKTVPVSDETDVLREVCKVDAACAKDIAEIVVSYP